MNRPIARDERQEQSGNIQSVAVVAGEAVREARINVVKLLRACGGCLGVRRR